MVNSVRGKDLVFGIGHGKLDAFLFLLDNHQASKAC